MTDEELKATYPNYTVFVYEEKGEITTAQTSDYYINLGKSYADIKEKIKEKEKWREIQNKELYQVTKLLNSCSKRFESLKNASNYFERIQEISYELDNLVNDMENDL